MSNNIQVQLRNDTSLYGWPGTMGGIVKRVHSDSTESGIENSRVFNPDSERSLIKRIDQEKKWKVYWEWYQNVMAKLGLNESLGDHDEGEIVNDQFESRVNDISLLPSRQGTAASVKYAFDACTRSDHLTSKRPITNPSIDMNEDEFLTLSYRCPHCNHVSTISVTMDQLVDHSSRDTNGDCLWDAKTCGQCKAESAKFQVTAGSKSVYNYYKVLVTLDNDKERIVAFLEDNTSEIENWVGEKEHGHLDQLNGKPVFRGSVTKENFPDGYIADLCNGLHNQYKFHMLGIIVSVSDAGTALEIPNNMTPVDDPRKHWVKKRHIMTDLWWGKISAMLKEVKECDYNECSICARYSGEDFHDVAPHIGHCDCYGRLHAGTDIFSLSWIERMMVTASYWDELGNKNPIEVAKAKRSIGRACADVLLGRDGDFDQRMSKLRCLLNCNTYSLRRALIESRYRATIGLGAFRVGRFENLAHMIRGRLYEGMTLPYVEDTMLHRSCTDCADIIVLAGQLGIVFHDAIDLPNDTFNGEYMNAYRMAASGGYDALMRFTRGANTLLRLMSTTGAKQMCCGKILQCAIANSVGWYFYCARYNYPSNVQLVYKLDYTWEYTMNDVESACWVGKLLGCNDKTLEKLKQWEHLPLTSHQEWGCGNTNPKQRFHLMRDACLNGKICDLDEAETEAAEVFCDLTASGIRHICGVEGNCLCCEVTYECIEMTIKGDMVGRFVHHALRLAQGSIEMAIDN